jgi:uncharacterized protein with von Willebrand factor type A (vWA) domain
MKLRARASRIFGRKQLNENTVAHTRVDRAVYGDVVKRSPKMQASLDAPPMLKVGPVSGSKTKLDKKVWNKLAEDTFYEFYGDDEPQIHSRDKIDPLYHVNRALTDKQARMESFTDTRAMTRGNVLESAIGTMGALRVLRTKYANELSEHAMTQNEIANAESAIDNIDAELEKLRQLRVDDPSAGSDETIRELAKIKRKAVDELKDIQAHQASQAINLADAVKSIVAEVADSAKNAVEAMSLLPGTGKGPGKRVSPDEMMAFAERVHKSSTMRDVLAMMGRLELSMSTTRRQLRHSGYEEIVDIETGNDLRSVLPQERALLVHPLGKLDFYRRYAERSLMQYETWSEQDENRGPLIFLADGSDSMRGAKNVFCRGLVLAACAIAHREKRDALAIEFGSTGQLLQYSIAYNGVFDTDRAVRFAEHLFAGGTDIGSALVEAATIIRGSAPFASADVVIVTDGYDTLTEQSIEVRDYLHDMGVKIHGITIGIAPTEYMTTVCDYVSSVFAFTGANNASDKLSIEIT